MDKKQLEISNEAYREVIHRLVDGLNDRLHLQRVYRRALKLSKREAEQQIGKQGDNHDK